MFSLLKLAGALYLLWLAYALWTAPVTPVAVDWGKEAKPLKSLFWQSLLISILNPKGPVFYVAFVPQFVNTSGPVSQQFGILIATFVAVAALNSLFWLFFANGMRAQFRKPNMMRALNRVGASCLCIAGLFTAKATRVS